MPALAHVRSGAGEPLVLLPGLGFSHHVWDPVVPTLAAHFDVIAVDLPGFGDSAPLPPGVAAHPAALAAAVARLLDDLGVGPVHLVGNSLGGWVALELAALRPAASVTLLSPAGMWRRGTPLYCRVSLRASRWLTAHAPLLLSRLVATRLGRSVVLFQTYGRPSRVTPAEARAAFRDVGTAPGFDAVLRATAPTHYRATRPISAPVTVAFGARDRLLLRGQSRHLDELPPDVHVGRLPGGHVPAAVDAPAVVALLRASTARGAAVSS